MEEKLWEIRHKRLNEKIEVHDKRINNHSESLDRIKLSTGKLVEILEGLINQLESLNTTLRWFIGALVGALSSTKITTGTGYIYVPSALVEEYKSAAVRSIYAEQIRAIEDYPKVTGGATI